MIFVDDDPDLRRATAQALTLAGFAVRAFDGAEAALAAISEDFEGPVVTDIRMPRMNGLQLFERIKAVDPELPVLLVTGHADVELAVAALKDGVYDFISKPFDAERLATAVEHAAEKRRLVLENRRLRAAAAETPADLPLIGDAAGIRRLRESDPPGRRRGRRRAGARRDRVGQGGGGAAAARVERAAREELRRAQLRRAARDRARERALRPRGRRLHRRRAPARRADRARERRHAVPRRDRVLPAGDPGQALRVLETREVEPLGTNERRKLDLRVVAATKVDLGDPAARGSFREDLYYRLNVVTLRIPPLRERRGDIPLLFAHFLKRAADRFGRPVPEITAAARDHLARHDWAGNVRELLHFADRTALGLAPEIEAARPEPVLVPALAAGGTLPERVDACEAELIRAALREHRGDVRATIEALGVPRKTFYDKLKRHGIQRAEFEADA